MESTIDPTVQTHANSKHVHNGRIVEEGAGDPGSGRSSVHQIDNVFTFNEYMDGHGTDGDITNEGSTEAALDMINFSGDENGDENGDGNDHGNDIATNLYHRNVTRLPDGSNPKEVPIRALMDEKEMKIVEYDHKSKPQKLGRPRNHVLKHTKVDPKNGDENENQSKYMLYRLDDRPLEGPGSRGGKGEQRKQNGKLTFQSIKKRKQKQSQLIFNVRGLGLNKPDNRADDDNKQDTHNTDENSTTLIESESNGSNLNDSDLKTNDNTEDDIVDDNENNNSVQSNNTDDDKQEANGPSSSPNNPKATKQTQAQSLKLKKGPAKSKSALKPPASRTTVLNGRFKVTRQFPGPLVPLHYDLYDENFMNSNQNKDAMRENLAFGFPVKPSPHASDIIFIISFISKFSDLLQVGKVGPQDIEEGLGLTNDDNENQPESNNIADVSPLMNNLFARLLTLVLNRKPEVNPKFQGKAVSELKSLSNVLGLPREWKDNHEAYEKYPINKEDITPVDQLKPEILISEGYKFNSPYVYENPFNDKQGFEKIGFSGIKNATDRLIMLRTLVEWCLTASNDIKAAISDMLLKQDIPGDKETYYGSRAVLKGFKHAEDITKETNNKIQKKKYTEDNEIVQRYLEPVSDPLQHPLRLRVNEQVIGDVGFHIGRFYLCRTADIEDGGLSSVKTMKQVRNDVDHIRSSYAARFKLYVQDTYKLLLEGLCNEGIEFNENGEHISKDLKPEELPDGHFFEIAGNATGLENFINHLGNRLGFVVNDGPESDNQDVILSSTSAIFKPAKALYEYLSGILALLFHQENLRNDSARSSRKRAVNVDYNEASANKKMRALMGDVSDDEQLFQQQNDNDDDEAYDDDEEEPLDIGPDEDEDDGDYMD